MMRTPLLTAMCLISLGGAAPAQAPLHQISGLGIGDQFGWAVAGGGDLDGDGIADVVVGSPHDDLVAINAGAVRAYSGATGALLLTWLGPAFHDHAGFSVDVLADVDGDGRDDVLIGVPYTDPVTPGAFGPGCAYLISGQTGATLHTFHGPGTVQYDDCGRYVVGLGDVDGDGIEDYAASAPYHDVPFGGGGRADVVSGATGQTLVTILGPGGGDHLGWSLADVGDLDGDGIHELACGSPDANTAAGADAGEVNVYSVAQTPAVLLFTTSPAPNAGAHFGWSLDGVGDVDGDQIPDFVAGAPDADVFGLSSGAAWVLSGADGSVIHAFYGENPGERLGYAVGGVADATGDGIADVVLGAPFADGGGVDRGVALLVSGESGAVAKRYTGDTDYDYSGYAVAGLPDLDQDGLAEVILGGIQYQSAMFTTGPGRVTVQPGCAAPLALSIDLGPGCGVPGLALTSTLPLLGRDLTLTLTSAPPAATGTLFVSDGGAPPLPLPGGCTAYVDLATVAPFVPVATDPAGAWSFLLPLPAEPVLSGTDVVLQALLATPMGLTLSSGRRLVLGS